MPYIVTMNMRTKLAPVSKSRTSEKNSLNGNSQGKTKRDKVVPYLSFLFMPKRLYSTSSLPNSFRNNKYRNSFH